MNQELRWETATWLNRVWLVVMWSVMWGVVFPMMIFGGLTVIAIIIEGIGEQQDNLRRCQKHAVTPSEYHLCR